MKRTIFIAVLSALLLLVSCKDKTPDDTQGGFLKRSAYGLYNGSQPLFTFDETVHQSVSNPELTLYRIQTDDQSQYVNIVLDQHPNYVSGQVITMQLTCKGIDGLKDGTYQALARKSQTNRLWLWSEALNMGFIVP